MKLWIARDKYNSLSICTHKHIYDEFLQIWTHPKKYYDDCFFHIYIPENLFLEITFENSPQEVELKLVK